MKTLLLLIATLSLSGCMSYSPQRYVPSPDNTPILRALQPGKVHVDPFVFPASFDQTCRGGTNIDPPINMTFAQYIQNALADELKIAGLYDAKSPDIVLRGSVEELSFS